MDKFIKSKWSMPILFVCVLTVVVLYNGEPPVVDNAASPDAETAVKTYAVVKSGQCYSWKSGSYVAPDCYATPEEAERIISRLKQIRAKHEEAQNKTWEIVDS